MDDYIRKIAPAKNKKELMANIIKAFPELAKYKSVSISRLHTSEHTWFSHFILAKMDDDTTFESSPSIYLMSPWNESLNRELVAKHSSTCEWQIWDIATKNL